MDAFSDERLRSQNVADEGGSVSTAGAVRPQRSQADGAEAIRRIINALLRRWRLILATMVVGCLLGVAGSIIFPPTYLANALLILDLRRPDMSNPNAAASFVAFSSSLEDSAIDTHITTLVSDLNLRRSLQALGALSNKDDTGPSGNPPTDEENAALSHLRRGLKVGQERKSKIISVGYNDRDPARAAQVANTVVQVYVDSLRHEKRDEAELAVTQVTRRLDEVREQVARAESDLHAYRESHVANNTTGPNQPEQQITQTARQLALLKLSTAAVQKQLDDLRNLQARGGSTLAIAGVLDSPRLTELADEAQKKMDPGAAPAGPPLPDLLRAIDSEIAAIASRLELEHRTAQSQVQSIESRLGLLRQAAKQADDDTVALRALERNASVLGQLYEGLLRQRQDLTERSKLAEPEIRILALAEPPPHPASLRRIFLIPPALVAFALLGCMIALSLDRLDHTLHGQRETAEALQIPCAGLTPKLTLREAKYIPRLLLDSPGAPYTKAIRALFAAAAPLCPSRHDQKVLLVTSSVPGEGKTRLAWSLAVSAAQLRWNVLLLEVGRQASTLRTEALDSAVFPTPAGSLFDVMARRHPLASVAASIPGSGISFLALSHDHNDLLALLANPDFPNLIEQIRETYDLVIIDAPSVFDSSEVGLLCSKADKVLFAVHWGRTPRATAHTAVQLIQNAGHYPSVNSNKIVSVLTNVDVRQHARYHFADQGDYLADKPNT